MRHHVPNRHIGIWGENRFGLIRHFVFDDMRLVLHTFAPRRRRETNHIFRDLKIAAMIDTNLSNHQRGVVGRNFTVSDFHVQILIETLRLLNQEFTDQKSPMPQNLSDFV